MAVDRKTKPKAQDFIDEMKQIILRRFPDAEFQTYRINRKDFRIHVTANFQNAFDVLDITADRTTDILVEHDIYIGVLPLRRSEN